MSRVNNELKELHEYAEAIVETVQHPLVVLDADLRVKRANRSFYENFKVSREETEDSLIYSLGSGQWNIPRLKELLVKVLAEDYQLKDFEITGEFPHIGQRTMLLNACRIYRRGIHTQTILLAIEDITERKWAANAMLTARAEAEAANRAKDEFIAMVSHELRTPLSAILGWARLLRSGQLDEANLTHGLEIVERNAKAQMQLIDDLLDISRIVAGSLSLDVSSVELASVVKAVVEDARLAAEDKDIRLEVVLDPDPCLISGDPDRLQQVVRNLLSNAIKFTPKGGRVQLRLKRANTHAEIIVSDTGIGIEPEFLPHVFERFRQADSVRKSYSGLGLGLAIARYIVELHGGTIRAESAGKGQGATFTIRLPLGPVSLEASDIGPKVRDVSFDNPTALEGLRLLIVDDEADARELLTLVLENCGAEVTAVASAAEALDALEQAKPDALISDIAMPGDEGYDLIRKIRALEPERGGGISAVALTAHAGPEDRMRALSAGYQAHIPKPFEPAQLVAVIASLVGRSAR